MEICATAAQGASLTKLRRLRAVVVVTKTVSVVRVLVRARKGRVNGVRSRPARGTARSKIIGGVVVSVAGWRWVYCVWMAVSRELIRVVWITAEMISILLE